MKLINTHTIQISNWSHFFTAWSNWWHKHCSSCHLCFSRPSELLFLQILLAYNTDWREWQNDTTGMWNHGVHCLFILPLLLHWTRNLLYLSSCIKRYSICYWILRHKRTLILTRNKVLTFTTVWDHTFHTPALIFHSS